MGIYDEQFRTRKKLDQEMLENAYINAVGAVIGNDAAQRIQNERQTPKQAIDELLKYYRFKPIDIPTNITDYEQQLDYCLQKTGMMKRNVKLEKKWWKDSFGAVMAYTVDGSVPVTLLPAGFSGYYYRDKKTNKKVLLNEKNAAQFDENALCFYRPFPQRKMTVNDLTKYMRRCVSINDALLLLIAISAIAMIGLTIPVATRTLTGPVISGRDMNLLLMVAVCIICAAFSDGYMRVIMRSLTERIRTKVNINVQAAMMMRILSLPTSFFMEKSAGELATRSTAVNQFCNVMVDMFSVGAMTAIVSAIYLGQIFTFAAELVIPSLLTILAIMIINAGTVIAYKKVSRKHLERNAKENGFTYAMINGIQKIKLAGAEKRFFAKWLDLYAADAQCLYSPPLFLKINSVLTLAVTLVSGIVLCCIANTSQIGKADYLAFSSAYGFIMGAVAQMTELAVEIGQIEPILETAKEFFEAEPETTVEKENRLALSSEIKLEQVYFRYNDYQPYILNNLSIRIRPQEYVAIVGKTGCGKSTLLRLMLGFETPERGAVYFGGKELSKLDITAVRRMIGTVMQNGKLLPGDIFTNITIAAPELTMDDAWDAAEKAGIADDIRAMPMGMRTMIADNQSISGGQKQRILLARAIAAKPKIMLLDEATSALDNKTQKYVSDTLASLKCTRIVVAHRLSTIRNCDRILVLEDGRFIEDGTYDELIAKGGFFASLVARQRLGNH